MSGLVVLADLVVIALGMIFAAFCIWLIVQVVNRPERLRSWTKDPLYQRVRRALSVIIVAGVAAICTACLFLRDQSLSFMLFTRVYMDTIALTALPTVFFVAAVLMSSKSARMQRAIARTAGCFGIVAVGVALAELSRDSLIEMPDWYLSLCGFVFWIIGIVVSVGLLLVAGAKLAWGGWCRVVSTQAEESGRS